MMMKINKMEKKWLFIALAIVIGLILIGANTGGKKATYATLAPATPTLGPGGTQQIDLGLGCLSKGAVGLASSLLPREISTQQDFGVFSPDDLLKNQNFLDPSRSIGINSVSGSLRNANQQVRSDPPIPVGSVPFYQSTITPDNMHPYFEIGCSDGSA